MDEGADTVSDLVGYALATLVVVLILGECWWVFRGRSNG